MNSKISKVIKVLPYLMIAIMIFNQDAYAATENMPWEGLLKRIENSISGPVARAISVLAIVVTGLGIAFGEGGGGMRKMLWVVFGVSIAFAAAGFFMSDFFGFGQGLSF